MSSPSSSQPHAKRQKIELAKMCGVCKMEFDDLAKLVEHVEREHVGIHDTTNR